METGERESRSAPASKTEKRVGDQNTEGWEESERWRVEEEERRERIGEVQGTGEGREMWKDK